ncbi:MULTISPECIES: hypothetical protein [Bartonella]|uniref:hypothetical protein n=1 Tax=Bartonella TaxID=773 RepID=UPI0018DDDA5F|nr:MULTISPECIES: hypothetical protein [Bartonella]MBI0169419.1 hypothetical protein [Bartonella sp. W8167]MBI0174593.1 hypothetical protein [Bartonella apis]
MLQKKSSTFPAGILGGLFAAVLATAIMSFFLVFPPLALLLGCFMTLPIFIVAFGWGTIASIISLITATIVLVFAQNLYIGLGFALLFFLPAVYGSWLLGLAETDKEGHTVQWYPLSSVIFLLTGFISIICVIIGTILHNNPTTPIIAGEVANFVANSLRETNSASEADIVTFHDFLVTNIVPLLSSSLATYGVLFLIGNLYFSLVGAQRMKRLARPRDDWPKKFRLPIPALVIFIVAFGATFFKLGTFLNLCASVFNTTFTLAISMTGLAYLHNLTRGMSGRIFILGFVYIALFTFVFTLPVSLILLLMGIWTTIQESRKSGETKQ